MLIYTYVDIYIYINVCKYILYCYYLYCDWLFLLVLLLLCVYIYIYAYFSISIYAYDECLPDVPRHAGVRKSWISKPLKWSGIMGCNGTNMVGGAESRVEVHLVRMTIVAQVVNLPIPSICRMRRAKRCSLSDSISFFLRSLGILPNSWQTSSLKNLGWHGITSPKKTSPRSVTCAESARWERFENGRETRRRFAERCNGATVLWV